MEEWLPSLSGYFLDLINSIILIAILVLTRLLLLYMLTRRENISIETKRNWAISLRNVAVLIGLVGLIIIWSKEIQAVALSMIAVAVALVIATKELIMCLGGSFLRAVSNSYKLGDHIEVGQYRGQVVDITFLSTTIMEFGPGDVIFQFSGRAITLPNSLLLMQPVIRMSHMGEYIVHSITIIVPFDVDIAFSERISIEAAREICAPFLETARRHMEKLEKRHLVDTPSVAPRIAVQLVDEKHYKLILRVAIPAKERHRVEQAILHRFMRALYDKSQAKTAETAAQPSHL